jgi:hypothetical protein
MERLNTRDLLPNFSQSGLNVPAYVYPESCKIVPTINSHPYQFSSRGRLLTEKLIIREFLQSLLMSAFCKFCGRYNDLIYNHLLSLSMLNHMLSDIFHSYV